ncbi:helix-turn-helix transcriptional regulator [Gordonia sp. Z-3]|uniref:helix-turn-helix transcriptional regulator n=1 Tax=Gordonia sp. Z-3 TaxID=3115408 RepID=UPI002E2CAC4C|nr:helix-turn-helix transcriptional regulator [Gordonia sp. Z-3]MED5803112.1 helix-turn-helix transcriptional regulator [Gordonia sp. Z-3]
MRSLTAGAYHEVLGSAADLNTRADELLSALGDRVASSASAISLWDPLSCGHLTLANHHYPDVVMSHFNSWFVANDPLFKQMERTRSGALRWQDFPDYRSSHSVTNVFTPAGFDEGLSARLVTASGAYVGTLHVNSDDRRYPRDRDVEEINELRRSMAALLDVTTRPVMVADFLAPGSPAWLVDRRGNCMSLHDEQPSLSDLDPALLSVIAQHAGGERQFRWCDDTGTWFLIRLFPATPRHRAATPVGLAVAIPEPLPFELTARELEVVTLIAEGLTTVQIATALTISAKTVGHHVEHILAKTGAGSRVGLAALANQRGVLAGALL